uniref:Uncharacterized protein n=1 Tax=Mola mola TaxID=94237 RepID=A0A3Q3WBK5_MOLML
RACDVFSVLCVCVCVCMCVFLTCISSSCDAVVYCFAPLVVLRVPHTDLIMCPREVVSPVGKEEIPGVGGSLSCEKSNDALRHGDSLPLRCQGAEGIILPGGFSDKSSICPECLVSMVTEACIVCFSALSSAVCFLDRPLTGFKAF